MSERDVNEKSPMIPADAVSAFAHHTPGAVAAGVNGLEKGVCMSDKELVEVVRSVKLAIVDLMSKRYGADHDAVTRLGSFSAHEIAEVIRERNGEVFDG